MVGTFVSNYHSWGRPGAGDMTIFVSYVGPHFPNIGDFDVYGIYIKIYQGIQRYLKVYGGI